MINIFENDTAGSNSSFLDSMSHVTLVLSIIPLGIFIWLAARSKNIRAFQFQISTFIAVYVLGEIIENGRITVFSVLPSDIGSQIHVVSAILFATMIWFRFYYAEKSGKRMIESSTGNSDSDSGMNSTNI